MPFVNAMAFAGGFVMGGDEKGAPCKDGTCEPIKTGYVACSAHARAETRADARVDARTLSTYLLHPPQMKKIKKMTKMIIK